MSLRSILSTFSLLTQTILSSPNPLLTTSAKSCPHPQLSCHNTTAVSNLCCFNAPGGTLLQTQFWDTDPASGPDNSWTIHGLWPDNCDGTYAADCDNSRAYTNITEILKSYGKQQLLDYMNKYWTSNEGSAESFWEHEWGKHGTCISTLDPDCFSDYKPGEEVPLFFQTVVNLFKTLPTYTWLQQAGITPSTSKTYSLSQIQQVLSKRHGDDVYLGCYNGQLDEVWYFYNVKGALQSGKFIPTPLVGAKSTCPETGIKYLPKGSSSGGGSSSSSASGTATSTSTPSPTGPAFSGKGYLNVIPADTGKKNGCVISYGTWYTTGTCATFETSASSNGGFTLESSKGACAVSSGKLTCGSSVSSPTEFEAQGSKLTYSGSTEFYAENTPSGSQEETIYTGSQSDGVSLAIEWQSI